MIASAELDVVAIKDSALIGVTTRSLIGAKDRLRYKDALLHDL